MLIPGLVEGVASGYPAAVIGEAFAGRFFRSVTVDLPGLAELAAGTTIRRTFSFEVH